jgi:hypothetical protein
MDRSVQRFFYYANQFDGAFLPLGRSDLDVNQSISGLARQLPCSTPPFPTTAGR